MFFLFNCFILKMLAGNSTPKEKENNKHEKQKERDNEMFLQASSAPPVHRSPRSLGEFHAWINYIDKKKISIFHLRNQCETKGYTKFESLGMTAGFFPWMTSPSVFNVYLWIYFVYYIFDRLIKFKNLWSLLKMNIYPFNVSKRKK